MPTSNHNAAELELLRRILLGETTARLLELEAAQSTHELEARRLAEQLQQLRAQTQDDAQRLSAELAERHRGAHDQEALLHALTPVIGDALKRRINASAAEMVEIVAPLLAPGLKKQIADSKSAMVEALHPLIGPIVARAAQEYLRRLARRLEARKEEILALLCVLAGAALVVLLWQRLF